MSGASWLKEFYPVSAKKSAKSNKVALEHALKKWRGLTKANLKRHGLERRNDMFGATLVEHKNGKSKDILEIASDSCALCVRHMHTNNCHGCPIASRNALDKHEIGCEPPYMQFVEHGRATPMIKRIEKALKNG